MGHYSIRLKVRKHRKKIAARANKNNFKYELSYWRASVDKWHKSTITGEYTICGAAGMKRTHTICDHRLLKVATLEKRKEVLDNFEKHNGGFKQPGYYVTNKNNKNRYLIEPMSQMTYLRKLAWHKMDKWDRKNPKPTYPENCTDIDKKILDETYKKLRANIYSNICTSLLRIMNYKYKRTFYEVRVLGYTTDAFPRVESWYAKNFTSLDKARKDLVNQTKKYMVNGSGTFNKRYYRTNLNVCTYEKGRLIHKMYDYHTLNHPAKDMLNEAFSGFIKNLKISIAGGNVIPFKPEIAYVA